MDSLLHHSSLNLPSQFLFLSPYSFWKISSALMPTGSVCLCVCQMWIAFSTHLPLAQGIYCYWVNEGQWPTHALSRCFMGDTDLSVVIQVICQCTAVPSRFMQIHHLTFPFKAWQTYDSLGGRQQAICINLQKKMGKALVTVWIHSWP